MTRPPRVVHLDELEAMPGPGTLTWHPVRAHLGIRAFGTNAFSAQRTGDDVVEPHEENPDLAHEELYFVARGRATFTLDDETFDESDPARAREVVQDGLENHPESPGMRIALARVLLQEGDEAGARAALRDALERQPDAEDYVRQVPELAALL